MRRHLRKAALCVSLMLLFTGCGDGSQPEGQEQSAAEKETVTLNIAYQYGLAYAPLMIAQEQGMIEDAYEEATGKELTVVWNQMSSGADINTGISSGSIDVGFMGVGPAVTGVVKGVGYKIFTNLSGQEHGLMTNDENIRSLEDLIGSEKQIALVNIGSIQHMILAKALENSGYDPHALDSNIVAMKHPDGMTALETGNVSCHLTSNPYIFMEREEGNLYEIEAVSEAWGIDQSFIVGVASETLYESDPELYQALCKAIEDAVNYMNDYPEEAAAVTCEFDGNSEADELVYIQKSKYMIETRGVYELATFMARAGFIEEAPESYSELVFDNVTGD